MLRSGYASDTFIVRNGVKQGGVSSPILFCIYIDNLLIELSSSGVGCYMGSIFIGDLAYADDIVLITPNTICHASDAVYMTVAISPLVTMFYLMRKNQSIWLLLIMAIVFCINICVKAAFKLVTTA